MTHPLLSVGLEDIQALDDADLADLCRIGEHDLGVMRRAYEMAKGELVRRVTADGASQRRMGSQLVVVDRPKSYEWDFDAVRRLVEPLVTPEQWVRAWKEKPPEPPKPKVTIHTQAMLGLARRVGKESEVRALVKETFGPPKLVYEDRTPAEEMVFE